jgi:hypothetical protein
MSIPQTSRYNRDPSEYFLHDGFNIWKVWLITKLRKSFVTDNTVKLCLSLLLDIGVKYHGEDKRVYRCRGLVESESEHFPPRQKPKSTYSFKTSCGLKRRRSKRRRKLGLYSSPPNMPPATCLTASTSSFDSSSVPKSDSALDTRHGGAVPAALRLVLLPWNNRQNGMHTTRDFTSLKGAFLKSCTSFRISFASFWNPAPGTHAGTYFTVRRRYSTINITKQEKSLTHRKHVYKISPRPYGGSKR